MKQLELYNPAPPAQVASPTSVEAAEKVLPQTARLRRLVLDWLTERGEAGGTDEEIQDGLGMNPSTQRPRRVELWRGGFVRDSGRTRQTRSGRRAVVWVATGRR